MDLCNAFILDLKVTITGLGGSKVKNPPASERDMDSIGLGKHLWRQTATHSVFLPGKLMDRGAWQADNPWVAKELDALSD